MLLVPYCITVGYLLPEEVKRHKQKVSPLRASVICVSLSFLLHLSSLTKHTHTHTHTHTHWQWTNCSTTLYWWTWVIGIMQYFHIVNVNTKISPVKTGERVNMLFIHCYLYAVAIGYKIDCPGWCTHTYTHTQADSEWYKSPYWNSKVSKLEL